MRIPLSALLISTLVLAGCGSSRWNPVNWFGGGRSEPVAVEGTNPLIPRKSGSIFRRGETPYTGQLVDKVTGLKVERVPGGAVVRVTGVARLQGQYDVKLISPTKKKPEKGVLTFELRAELPAGRQAQGTEWTRTLTVATFLTDNELFGVGTIRVVGATNAMTSRR
ncbi:hypothetical protein E7681_12485 [Thalassobius vesicularis]|uniref:Lipoprotein n=1 Tax=Thalassobius vesicularis TaxID=1294297 RepID=A0A4S3M8U4_9RHOB|nr:hypothetical protein [Thalassobius vesicularis]THD73501.1 hypothetical protein E7681_12485 [Thalassobius vesicularis]